MSEDAFRVPIYTNAARATVAPPAITHLDPSVVFVCSDCGALVYNTAQHTDWHKEFYDLLVALKRVLSEE